MEQVPPHIPTVTSFALPPNTILNFSDLYPTVKQDITEWPLNSSDSDEQDVNSVIANMLANGNTLSWCIHNGTGMFKFTKVTGTSTLQSNQDTRSTSLIALPLSKKEKELGLDCSTVYLFRSIKEWRLDTCRSKNIPAFSVLYDSVLVDITKLLPQSIPELKCIKGIGEKKALEYGQDVLRLVSEYKSKYTNSSETVCWFDPMTKLYYSQ
jgi:superfamily II DNA helicase RecQ